MELEYWVWLLMAYGPHNPGTIRLVAKFKDARTVYEALLNGDNSLSAGERARLSRISLDKAREIVFECEKKKVLILPINSPQYPTLLKSIYNPPLLLFVGGDISALDGGIAIAAVGSRNASEYSIRAGRYICEGLAKSGFTIVSGLAMGLDTVAHRAATDNGTATVAVLACGIFDSYPEQNLGLRRKIIDCGGAVISELLPTTKANAAYFKMRNRIMSGLARGVLILQAAESSGCILTAEHAVEQGREIFCIPPHDIMDKRFAGVVRYLRDGAVPVFSHHDIVYEYYAAENHRLSLEDERDSTIAEIFSPKAAEKPTEKPTNEPKPAPTVSASTLKAEEISVLRALGGGEMQADVLTDRLGVSYIDLCLTLTDLELNGLVKALPGGAYAGLAVLEE